MELLNIYIEKLFGYPLVVRYEWRTDVVSFDSSKEQRNQVLAQPIRHWTLPYSNLSVAQRNKLVELFNRAKGRYGTFKFEDPNDFQCLLTECSITAIAAQTDFQLIKSYYIGETETWNENKSDIQPSTLYPPLVRVDGAIQTEGVGYTLDDSTGIVIFGAAPGAGKVITADYRFYYRVRFDVDIYEEGSNVEDIWSSREIEIVEVIS